MSYKRINTSLAEHDAFIDSQQNGFLFQLSLHGEMQAAFGYPEYLHVNIANKQGEICGANLATLKDIPYTPFKYAYLRQAYVLDYEAEDWKKRLKSLHQATVEVLKEAGVIYFRFDIPVTEEHDEVYAEFAKLGCQKKATRAGSNRGSTFFRLYANKDISQDEEEILAELDKKTRWMIRKANSYNLQYQEGTKADIALFNHLKRITNERNEIDWYEQETAISLLTTVMDSPRSTMHIVKLVPELSLVAIEEDIKKFEQDLERLKKRKNPKPGPIKEAEIALNKQLERKAEIEKLTKPQTLSMGITVQTGKTMQYRYAASSNDFRDAYPNYFMIWEMIKFAKRKGCEYFEMGATETASEDTGLYAFKAKWNVDFFAYSGDMDYVINKPFGSIFRYLMRKKDQHRDERLYGPE